jgi:LPS export ABC transporter protein LptC
MHLKRTAVFWTTRVLSWILPVVILVFIGIAAFSYRNRATDAQPVFNRPEELPSELSIRSDRVQYIVSKDGKNQYEVQASKMLGFKDRRRQLADVFVIIYAQKPGDPDRRIHGDECTHDEEAEQIVCHGNVSVELETGTFSRTELLTYDDKTKLISSTVKTDLERVGEMMGHAGKMDYFVDTGLMRLMDNFVIETTEGGGIKGGNGVFQYKEHWATVSQGVELTSTNGRVLGGSGRADLLPGTYRAKRIVVEGGATAESPSLTVNSDWLQSDLSDAGSMEHVLGRGNVRAERHVPNDSLNGTLTSPEIEAWLDNGTLKAVEARQQPSFMGPGRKLTASETLRIEPEGSRAGLIRAVGDSSFVRDGMTIDGRNFSITERSTEQIFNTEGNSSFVRDGMTVRGRDFSITVKGEEQIAFNTAFRAEVKSGGLTTRADRTEAQLDSKTNTLSSLKQSGNMSFEEDKTGRSGAAERLTVRNGGDLVELEEGKPWFKDAQGTLNSRKITFDRKNESFSGDGAVRMTSAGKDGKPVVVQAGHVEGRLGSDNPRLEYTGRVQMFPPSGQIDADRLTAYPKENRFEAEGKVSTKLQAMEATADKLDFREAGENRQTAHYTGNVVSTQQTGKGQIMRLQTQDLNVELKSGEAGGAETIVATGGAHLTQGVRTGNGERLEHNARTGETLLIGTPAAEAEVRESGKVFKGCRIQILADGSKTATQCAGRSVTSEIQVNRN